eukprot:GILI01005114.1.p1 GENE.GILI01005114.1~~GILI01005114.1.p1  ORF type:complete len:511 (-),score=142.46 GILI01005114.1:400-1932(-)
MMGPSAKASRMRLLAVALVAVLLVSFCHASESRRSSSSALLAASHRIGETEHSQIRKVVKQTPNSVSGSTPVTPPPATPSVISSANHGWIKFAQSIPRYNFALESVTSRFDVSQPGYGVVFTAFAFFVAAGCAFLWAVAFLALRFGFNLCGGHEPRKEGYSLTEKRVPKVFMIFGMLLFVSGAVVAGISAVNFRSAITFTTDRLGYVGSTVYQQAASVKALLQIVNDRDYGPSSTYSLDVSFMNPVLADETRVRSSAQAAQSWLANTETYCFIILWVVIALALVSTILGIVALAKYDANLSLWSSILSMPALPLCLFILGTYLYLTVGMADVCDQIDTSVATNKPPTTDRYLGSVLACMQESTAATSSKGLYSVVASGEEALNQLNKRSMEKYNIQFTVRNASRAVTYNHMYDPITVNWASSVISLDLAASQLLELNECKAVKDALSDSVPKLCEKGLSWGPLNLLGHLLLAVSLFTLVLTGIKVNKRLLAHTRENDIQFPPPVWGRNAF